MKNIYNSKYFLGEKTSAMSDESNVIRSPLFLLSLILLLCNDLFFKWHFHNIITGKLSDFAGLIVFPLFFTAFFPKRRLPVFIITGLLFIFWKSPLSQTLIDTWNLYMFFPVARVIDYSDLIALIVLPISYYYSRLENRDIRIKPFIIITLSLFAFVATPQARDNISFSRPLILIYNSPNPARTENQIKKLPDYNLKDTDREYLGNFLIIRINDLEVNYFPLFKDEFEQALVKKRLLSGENLWNNTHNLQNTINIIEKATLKGTIFNESVFYNIRNSHLQGKQLYFYPNGAKKLIAFYTNGIESGTWVYYNEKGKTYKNEYYEKGELQKTVIFTSEGSSTTHAFTRKKTAYRSISILVLSILITVLLFILTIKNLIKKYPSIYTDIKSRWHIIGETVLRLIATIVFSGISIVAGMFILSIPVFGKFRSFSPIIFGLFFMIGFILFGIFYVLRKRPWYEWVHLYLFYFLHYSSFMQLHLLNILKW